MRLCATGALLGLLFLSALDTTGSLQTVVRPDKGSAVTVSAALPSDQCSVCTVSGANDTQVSCRPSLLLAPEAEVKLLFNCSQPLERSFTVTVARTIECTETVCSPATVKAQPSLLADFSRTFTWEIKAPPKTSVSLNILGTGLVETSQPCPSGFRYSVALSKASPLDQVGYCVGGSVTQFDLLNQAVVTLQVDPRAQSQLLPVVFQASAGPLKGRTEVVTVDSSTTVVVSRDPAGPECEVCSAAGSTSNCQTTKTLTNVGKLSLEFSCQKPQDVYTVKIQRKIVCTTSSCSPSVGQVDPNLFKDFQRSLKWDISVPERTVLTLEFPGDGLKEITGAGDCPGGSQYSVSTTKSDGSIKTSSYCNGGTMSQLDLHGPTTVTTEVPKGTDTDQTAFSAKAAPRGTRTMSVTPEPKTTIIITRVISEPDCSVCVSTAKPPCSPRRVIITNPGTSVEFTCPEPQRSFMVEINRAIDCTSTSCSGNIVQPESSLFPDFNRTFTWDLKVVSTQSFQLDFSGTGMRQIPKDGTCPNEHTYSLVMYLHTGPAAIGTFCEGGPVTSVLAPYKGRMTLQVPANRKLDTVNFKLNVSPATKMVAIVNVNLPRGVSDTDFFTPNYPLTFPDDQQVQWNFTVPGMHNYTVQFLQSFAPECISNNVEVEYQREGKRSVKLALTDPQPKHQQDNFNMVLRNCQTNTTLPGLGLSYRVSVMRSGHPVLCTVDLTKQPGLSLQIQKMGSDPYCEMSINATIKEKVDIAAGTKASLSFLDCPKEDMRLTASGVTAACQNVLTCPTFGLTVPSLDSCLPMPLHSFTWDVRVPPDSTVELVSPTGSLRQSLPGQECNPAFSLNLADEDGLSVGDFCYDGIIQNVQVHTNVSVTATTRDFSKITGPILNVTFSQEISDTIIYRVGPKISSPTLLATPNWPQGMTSFSSVSWIVDVPSRYRANIEFVNVSQPKCQDGHTYIIVKELGHEKEMLILREDNQPVANLSIPKSFYLNMSSCVAETGQFSVATRIVLQETSNLLAIILGVVGAVLLLLILLVVICVIMKKKKGRMTRDSSIYMGKGNIFRPGDNHFTKTRSENDSHIYNSIDDTMVYGHLLNNSGYASNMPEPFKGVQVDSYRTFTGPTDRPLPEIKEPDLEPELDQYKPFLEAPQTFIPSRPRTPIDRQDSLGFQDRRMMDNELFTFKSTGEINTIQLANVDAEPRRQTSEESF